MPKNWSWLVLWRPTTSSRTNTKNTCPFHHRALQSKNRKSRDTWSNNKFGLGLQNKAGQRLAEFCQENTLVIATQEMTLHSQYQNQTDFILYSWRWRSPIQSVKTRPGADCGSDHEFLIAKFRLKLKKVEKITRPFRYDLNKKPYDYAVEVMNRFKGLDPVDRVPEELWTEVSNIVQEAVTKTIPKNKKWKKAKWLSEDSTNRWQSYKKECRF